jgi:3-methyladenine DNA glycosylase AlkD
VPRPPRARTARAARARDGARDTSGLVADLQARLDAAAVPRTRDFWERYLRGAVPFRGAPMNAVRAALRAWWREHHLDRLPLAARKRLAWALLRERHGEDKLTGILALAEILLGALDRADLRALAALFDGGHLADWNSCDWLCVKVLGPFIAAGDGEERVRRAKAIAAWRRAASPWRRRAAAVALVPLARERDLAFPGFADLALGVCEPLARSPEPFQQTAAAWLVRELHRTEPARARAFLAEHASHLSVEALLQAMPRARARAAATASPAPGPSRSARPAPRRRGGSAPSTPRRGRGRAASPSRS